MFKWFDCEYNIRSVHGEIWVTRKKRDALSAINTNWAFVLTGREEYEIFFNHKNWFRPWLPTVCLEVCELAYLLDMAQWDISSHLASLID